MAEATAPNKLRRILTRVDRWPAWLRYLLFNFLLTQSVPFVGTGRVRVLYVGDDKVITRIGSNWRTHNHLQQVHAMATALLAETATGLMLGMVLPNDKAPLLKSVHIRYTRRTTGALTATATLPDGLALRLQTEDKGEVVMPVQVTDATGEAVIEAEYLFAWRIKEKL